MPEHHSGLHNLKRKKNLLAHQLTRFNQTLGPSLQSSIDLRALQSSVAVLQREYRAMHLADCYMRGRPYGLCEDVRYRRVEPTWELVTRYVQQHGGPIVQMPPLDEWSCTN